MQHPFRHFCPQGLSRAAHDPRLCFKKRKTPLIAAGLGAYTKRNVRQQHENPARTGEEGRVSRTLTTDLLREEGRVRLGIIDTLAYTDLTRPQHKRALKVGAFGATENHILGTANCKRVSDSALAFSAGGDSGRKSPDLLTRLMAAR